MAIGAINSISIATLSPGITISTPVRQMRHSRHVRRAEVKLWTIPGKERRVSSAFFLRQHIRFGLELRVRGNRTRLRDYLAALNVLALNSAQQQPNVVSRRAFVQQLLEHLDARHHRLYRRPDAHHFHRLAYLHYPALHSPVATVPRP